jgi:type II secretory pathway pseudopilin PulG
MYSSAASESFIIIGVVVGVIGIAAIVVVAVAFRSVAARRERKRRDE